MNEMWSAITDATNYEFKHADYNGGDKFVWIEGMDCEIGVEIRIERGATSAFVVNTEYEAGIELPIDDLLRYGRIAIDYVQFIEYGREEDYSFRDLADALLAMGCGYGFCGSTIGLGISLDYGFWLEITGGGYRLWGENGMNYHAATPAGCARAWKQAMADKAVFEWAENKRKVNA